MNFFITRKRATEMPDNIDASLNHAKKGSHSKLGKSPARLFDLPQEIFHKIIGEYLEFCTLVSIDNSVCNKADRVKYLALLANVTMKHKEYNILTISELEWIHRRQVRLETVEMGHKIDQDISLLTFPLYWPSIKAWRFTDGPVVSASLVVDCLLQCTSLETLVLNHQDYVEDDYDDDDYQVDEYSEGGEGSEEADNDTNEDSEEVEADEHSEYYGDTNETKYSAFNTAYVSEILRIFDDPAFCSHLRSICFFCSEETLIAMTKHCHNLTSAYFGHITASTALMMEFFQVCGATLETFVTPYFDDDLAMLTQDPFTKYHLPDVFQYCPRLQSITLDSQSSTNEALIEIGRYCPEVLLLHLWWSDSGFTDDALVVLFEGCRKLSDLCLRGPQSKSNAPRITDRAIIRASECCPNLRKVVLVLLPNLTVGSLESLAINCPMIEELFISKLTFSDRDLRLFSAHHSFPNLRSFHSYDNQLSDRFLLELVQKSPLLNHLSIHFELGNTSLAISNAGIQYIADHCRNLKHLQLCGLSGVTDPAPLIDIVTNNPHLNKDNFQFNPAFGVNLPKIVAEYDYRRCCNSIVYTKQLEALLNSRIYPRG